MEKMRDPVYKLVKACAQIIASLPLLHIKEAS